MKSVDTFSKNVVYTPWGYKKDMALKVEVEYIEVADEEERIQKVAKILAQGVYSYLKKEGLLRIDPNRKEKVREAMDKARELINRDIPTQGVDSA